jgi:hypothetical protein
MDAISIVMRTLPMTSRALARITGEAIGQPDGARGWKPEDE